VLIDTIFFLFLVFLNIYFEIGHEILSKNAPRINFFSSSPVRFLLDNQEAMMQPLQALLSTLQTCVSQVGALVFSAAASEPLLTSAPFAPLPPTFNPPAPPPLNAIPVPKTFSYA
jgi:hypothetical protein